MNFRDHHRHQQLLLRRHAAERTAAAHAAEAARAAHGTQPPAVPQKSGETAEAPNEQAHHGPLRRFNRQQAGSRQARRSSGGDPRSPLPSAELAVGDGAQRIDAEGGANFGGGQGSSGRERDRRQSDPYDPATVQQAERPAPSAGGQAMADIVSAYVAGRARAGGDLRKLHGGSELARTLIALRDSQARHGDKAPLNHAVLRIVREFLALEPAPADLPRNLAEVRALLAAVTPAAVSAEELRFFHLKLPLVLLNLRRPRIEAQRIGARASISALLSRSAL